MNILVIDAQGGGIGRQLISGIRERIPDAYILAVGANSAATLAMNRAGADVSGTGENAARVACRKADVIVGPIGIIIADSMLGEITPAMAAAVAQSDAVQILIPFSHPDRYLVGLAGLSLGRLIEEAVAQILRVKEEHGWK